MTETSTPSGETLRYAVDITTADLDALKTFLYQRIRALTAGTSGADPVARAKRALETLAGSAVGRAGWYLEKLAAGVEPEVRLRYLHGLEEAWEDLVAAAEQWSDEAGFDRFRWREVDADPERAAQRHLREAERRAALATQRTAEQA